MALLTEVSVGEFLDKMTILEIKSERIKDAAKLANVRKELDALNQIWSASSYAAIYETADHERLKNINAALWEIEDKIRDKEAAQEFDAVFIELARAVYVTNDERARIKKEINQKLGSTLVEEKSYADYSAAAKKQT